MAEKPKRKEEIKVSGRKYAHLHFFEDGSISLHVVKRLKDIYREKGKSISDALREEVANWLIEDKAVRDAKNKGAGEVIIQVKENGDLYSAKLSVFDGAKKMTTSKSILYIVPIAEFEKTVGKLKL